MGFDGILWWCSEGVGGDFSGFFLTGPCGVLSGLEWIGVDFSGF